MKYFLAIFVLMCLSTEKIKSQQLISGLVLSSKDSTAIEGTHIMNISNNELAISTKSGSYEIKAKKLDTLLFSNINYKRRQFILVKLTPIVILLDPLTIQLEEVVVSDMPKSAAAFRKKVVGMEIQKKDNLKMEGLLPIKPKAPIPPLFQEEKLFHFGFNGNFAPMLSIPLYYFPKKFSKKYKSEMKYYSLQAEKLSSVAFEKKFNNTMLENLTKLHGDSLIKFIQFLDIDPSFVRRATDYEIAIHVKEQLILFKEKKE